MVTGVRGGEAGAGRAVVGEEPDRIRPGGVTAGPQAEDQVALDKAAADEVADDHRHDNIGRPEPAFFAEIEGSEYQEKKIERIPQLLFPDEGKSKVEEGVCPDLIDTGKKPVVTL